MSPGEREPVLVVYRQDHDRWIPGDRAVRRLGRRLLGRKQSRLSGMELVVNNFLSGLRRKDIPYRFNPPLWRMPAGAKVICFGLGALGLRGLRRDARLIAAIGFPHPSDIPDLCDRFDLRFYLQHSQWVLDWVKAAKIYPERVFATWNAGIDTDAWQVPAAGRDKDVDVLLYYKIHWDRDRWDRDLVDPLKRALSDRQLTVREIRYGAYTPAEYKALLARSRAMLFLSPHESQGLAYQEALSCNVPVLAWNPGYWLDPDRFRYGTPHVPATSVPFFDERCGAVFQSAADFEAAFDPFYDRARRSGFRPRDYVMENLTIADSTARMLQLHDQA